MDNRHESIKSDGQVIGDEAQTNTDGEFETSEAESGHESGHDLDEDSSEDERRPRSPIRQMSVDIPKGGTTKSSSVRNRSGDSFATAKESPSIYEDAQSGDEDLSERAEFNRVHRLDDDSDTDEGLRMPSMDGTGQTSNSGDEEPDSGPVSAQSREAATSLSSLLVHDNHKSDWKKPTMKNILPGREDRANLKPGKSSMKAPAPAPALDGEEDEDDELGPAKAKKLKVATGLVRFQSEEDVAAKDHEMRRRLANLSRRRPSIDLKRRKFKKSRDGEIIKMEKMLVRVEVSMTELPEDYDENASIKIDTRTIEKWREYVIVCRETGNEDAPMALKLYKSRVSTLLDRDIMKLIKNQNIPAIEKMKFTNHSTREIPLHLKTTHVNLYSSLDKTLVLWLPHKRGQIIYIMRPRSSAISVEWYTFLRNSLGWNRQDNLVIHVPDLSASLRIISPFEKVEQAKMDAEQSTRDTESIIVREERNVANHLMKTSIDMLKETPEWSNIIKHWRDTERVGLAWKR